MRARAGGWALGISLLVVLAPLHWLFSWTEGEKIRTKFENPLAAGCVR